MRNPWKVTSFILAGALAATIGYGQVQQAGAEKQPAMHAALANLNQARNNLQNATADKGGHRVKALALVDEAIEEVKKGIAFDNRH